MRYDTQVSFWNEGTDEYDTWEHKHIKRPKLLSTVFANVTDLGTEKQVQLLGAIKQGSKTIRMTALPPDKYDYIKIENDAHKYCFQSSMTVQKGYAMIVGQDNG